MTIALFGGSFNPPHLGHLIVIQQAFELIPNLDELWILPCFKHTFQKNLAPSIDRLKMSQLLTDDLPIDIKDKVKIETIEIDNKLSGETYEAYKLIINKYHQYYFSFLMGTDQLTTFKKWGNWEKLVQELPFYIYPRSGFKNQIKFPNMTLLKSPIQAITNLSSTLIRKRIKQGLTISHLLPNPVLKYIRINKLY